MGLLKKGGSYDMGRLLSGSAPGMPVCLNYEYNFSQLWPFIGYPLVKN
jgi:hypothetical protein